MPSSPPSPQAVAFDCRSSEGCCRGNYFRLLSFSAGLLSLPCLCLSAVLLPIFDSKTCHDSVADQVWFGVLGDVASAATLSRAVKDGRIRRLARGLYSADLGGEPAELVARNRWRILARFIPDALIADRSAAEGGLPASGVLTIVSGMRSEDLVLPGLVVAPRSGPGALEDDREWAEGLRLSSDARTLVDNLAVSRGRGGRPARTLCRSELEDWVVRTAQRRPAGWLDSLRPRALAACGQLGVPERQDAVAEIIGAVGGTREMRARAGPLLAARSAGLKYDPGSGEALR